MKHFIIVVLVSVMPVLISGCVKNADPLMMIPTELELTSGHSRTVSTDVSGGQYSNPMGTSQITDDGFKQALDTTLKEHGIFTAIIAHEDADYQLDVAIKHLGQPMIGVDMTVSLRTEWKLTKVGEDELIWQEYITSKYTAAFGEALVATERLQKANEGAARENIKQGIHKLLELKL